MHFQPNRAKPLWVAPHWSTIGIGFLEPKLIVELKKIRHLTDGRLRLVDIFSTNNLPSVLFELLTAGYSYISSVTLAFKAAPEVVWDANSFDSTRKIVAGLTETLFWEWDSLSSVNVGKKSKKGNTLYWYMKIFSS